MSHAADWTCRPCRIILGHVWDGVLRPVVAVESVDGPGVARVPCARCGQVRVWWPAWSDRDPAVLDGGHAAGHSSG